MSDTSSADDADSPRPLLRYETKSNQGLEEYPLLTSNSRIFSGIVEINVSMAVMNFERWECDNTMLANSSPPRVEVII